jgi:hypothetical protein
MLMGVTRANHKMRFKFWRTGVMAQLIVLGHLVLEGGHAEALEAVLQALGHFAQGRNEEMSDGKPQLLREGGLALMLASFRLVYSLSLSLSLSHTHTHTHTHTRTRS